MGLCWCKRFHQAWNLTKGWVTLQRNLKLIWLRTIWIKHNKTLLNRMTNTRNWTLSKLQGITTHSLIQLLRARRQSTQRRNNKSWHLEISLYYWSVIVDLTWFEFFWPKSNHINELWKSNQIKSTTFQHPSKSNHDLVCAHSWCRSRCFLARHGTRLKSEKTTPCTRVPLTRTRPASHKESV